jgi:hypothetical protein
MSIAEMVKMSEAWELLNVRRRLVRRLRPPVADRDEIWDMLQQPVHGAAVDPRYRMLRAALDVGWRIEEPVYLRPRWSANGPRVYHFILRRPTESGQRLLTVPEGSEVERFVRDEGLRVSNTS